MRPPIVPSPAPGPRPAGFFHASLSHRLVTGGSLASLGLDVERFPAYRNPTRRLHTCEMILLSYVVSGTGTHWLGSRHHDEGPGGLTVTHYGQRHDIVTARMDIINFYLDPTRLVLEPLGSGLDEVLSGWLPLEPALCRAQDDMVRLELSGRPLARELSEAMAKEAVLREKGWETQLLSLFRAFLVECCREALCAGLPRRGEQRRGRSEGVARVRRLLDGRYGEAHTLTALAAYAGLDKAYLCRAFKRATGRTVTEYLLERRLRAAVQRLRAGARSITEVALAVGFGDPAYFTRVFTRRIGVSPRKYRER